MLKGGYQIIDLKNKNLTVGVGMVYEGIYDTIEGTRKPILLSGIQVNDIEYHDTYANFRVVGAAYVSDPIYNGLTFKIEDTDVVTVSSSEPA